MNLLKLLREFLDLGKDQELIAAGKCPCCGEDNPYDDYEGDDCYLCPQCRVNVAEARKEEE